jgi:hypothetical protein
MNNTKAMIDMMMWYMENTLNNLRDARRALVKSLTQTSHKATAAQVVLATRQMLTVMDRYGWERMEGINGRRTFGRT